MVLLWHAGKLRRNLRLDHKNMTKKKLNYDAIGRCRNNVTKQLHVVALLCPTEIPIRWAPPVFFSLQRPCAGLHPHSMLNSARFQSTY